MSRVFGEARNAQIHEVATMYADKEIKDTNFFITLIGPLCGYCILVVAKDEPAVRNWAAENLGKTWCSIYSARPTEILIGTTTYLGDD